MRRHWTCSRKTITNPIMRAIHRKFWRHCKSLSPEAHTRRESLRLQGDGVRQVGSGIDRPHRGRDRLDNDGLLLPCEILDKLRHQDDLERHCRANEIHIGLKTVIKWPKGSFLHIADHEGTHPKRKVLTRSKHSFNLFDNLDYRKACDIVSAVRALFPDKENTLTKEGVPLVLLDALLDKPKGLMTC
jgi:hypothetical protein